ncbi:MAG: lipase maturation factor family protein [Opitutales bacterium]|nr:lipase maturation factor family protein [Opitutales bacterium]
MECKQNKKYTYGFAHWFFGRALGLVCFFAFISYWIQADALIGPAGINAWEKDLEFIETLSAAQEDTVNKWFLRPTLLWLPLLDNHNLLFAIGTLSAGFLILGFIPALSAIIAYVTYLSLMVVGGPFLSFQWDILLLETLLISLPFLPISRIHKLSDAHDPPIIGRFLLIALLAKLMLESGVVKFTFFDRNGFNTWRELTALDFHYWTQPLPHTLSPWIHALPDWFDQLSLFLIYATELVLPFLLFLPGKWRRIGVIGQIILQVAILLSGNYGFFNLLTLCLCIPLIDDQLLPSFLVKKISQNKKQGARFRTFLRTGIACILAFIMVSTTFGHLIKDIKGNQAALKEHLVVPKWIQSLQVKAGHFRCFNSYGLFRVMTTTRPEIIIEASRDGTTWQTYEFKWKPSHENQSLSFTGPHMPRIDWQMWFEGLNFENHTQHPFSQFLYGRFLQMMVNGHSDSVFSNLREVLGVKEFQALQRSPPAVQNQAITNYNHLIQSFRSRSKWFGSFLKALGEGKQNVLEQLSPTNPVDYKPSYLRVSLSHFKFSEAEGMQWEISKIPGASYTLALDI